MKPYCLIFPGQGSQFPGMSKGLDLNGLLDLELLRLMGSGPAEELNKTVHAQPAVLAVSNALWGLSGLDMPGMVMGHSLGEYMALVASGGISIENALRLVKMRALYMEQAQPGGIGGMAAVMGLSAEEISDEISALDDLWIANLNGAGQTVISGKAASIEQVMPKLKARGARRAVRLNLEVASHCPMMEKARVDLKGYLACIDIKSPSFPVVFNATAQTEDDPEKIKDLLADQLTSPVRWEESVMRAVNEGIDRFVEIGPCPVLSPLIKRILPGVDVEVITTQ